MDGQGAAWMDRGDMNRGPRWKARVDGARPATRCTDARDGEADAEEPAAAPPFPGPPDAEAVRHAAPRPGPNAPCRRRRRRETRAPSANPRARGPEPSPSPTPPPPPPSHAVWARPLSTPRGDVPLPRAVARDGRGMASRQGGGEASAARGMRAALLVVDGVEAPPGGRARPPLLSMPSPQAGTPGGAASRLLGGAARQLAAHTVARQPARLLRRQRPGPLAAARC